MMASFDIEQIKQYIIERLRPMDPEKVILFGSYAYGAPKDDSDIDLYIVSKENFVPQSYSENMKHYKKYSRPLKEIKKIIPVDVIVHTLEMNRLFEEGDSSLAKEIAQKGVRLM